MLSVDRFIVEFDKGLRTLFSQAHSARPYPMRHCRMRPWMRWRRSMPLP